MIPVRMALASLRLVHRYYALGSVLVHGFYMLKTGKPNASSAHIAHAHIFLECLHIQVASTHHLLPQFKIGRLTTVL
jgi:hypothetical protein